MHKNDVVKKILGNRYRKMPKKQSAKAFAPANIALCKYWGKRNLELNLPTTSSLSISLGDKGTTTKIQLLVSDTPVSDTKSYINHDQITFNQRLLASADPVAQRMSQFLDLFRPQPNFVFKIETRNNIPTSAGLATSASGFAALVLALDQLFDWQLGKKHLSILARLGSGSAARSLWNGFVKWYRGSRKDGFDSFAEPLADIWPELRVGLLILSDQEKMISSGQAMQQTVQTSPFYDAFLKQSPKDIKILEKAIAQKDFHTFGKVTETNALAMHATMLTAWPPICYAIPRTIEMMHCIWEERKQGFALYFTQDAGPNLKLLFLQPDAPIIKKLFPQIEIIAPFS